MATKKKMLQAAAGNAGGAGAGLDVDDVFSTYLYEGTGSAQTITNGIDLAGEGGLVWTKSRSSDDHHGLVDTERGRTVYLRSNTNQSNRTTNGPSYDLTSFNSNGFSLGPNWELYGNNNGDTYASWTFRKAPKFFDVVTYTGDGVAGRTVGHSLNSAVGCIIVKATNNARSWAVYHRGTDSTAPEDYGLYLNETTDRSDDAQLWNDTAPTSTEFTVGTDGDTNVSGRTYVAYLFAHNDGDGEFGPDGSDIIKCGSYSGTGNYQEIDLGFEAQWVMIKRTDSSQDWMIFDVMRGMPDQGGTGSTPSGNDARLKPNTSDAEQSDTYGIDPHANGFAVRGNNISVNGSTYIYIAIRRGPLAPPESGTDVFGSLAYTGDGASTREFTVGSAVSDMMLQMCRSSSTYNYPNVSSRLTDKGMTTTSTGAEFGLTTDFDRMDGVHATGFESTLNQSSQTYIMHSWKRAPKYMDCVAYFGNGTAGRTVSHNLGVAPEMMWVKKRNAAGLWRVYHKGLNGGTNPEQYGINLNETSAEYDLNTLWNDTAPTSSVFTLGTQGNVNGSSSTYIAYLFASLDGISKVGSVSHTTGSNTDVDCGFSAGARFVILKGADLATGWLVFDSTRGIISGNSPSLILNSTNAENSSQDRLDPYSSGFSVGPDIATGTWIYYAIA